LGNGGICERRSHEDGKHPDHSKWLHGTELELDNCVEPYPQLLLLEIMKSAVCARDLRTKVVWTNTLRRPTLQLLAFATPPLRPCRATPPPPPVESIAKAG